MKEIQLTQGQVALVDDEDFERINAHKWRALWNSGSKTFYAIRTSPRVNGERHAIWMHREIMRASDDDDVDHIDHNGLDNQRQHLRLCTHGQNCANRRMQANNTSGLKGVCWNKEKCKWQAGITVNRKLRHLGYFFDKIDAALAYDAAILKELDPYTKTNRSMGLIPLDRQK